MLDTGGTAYLLDEDSQGFATLDIEYEGAVEEAVLRLDRVAAELDSRFFTMRDVMLVAMESSSRPTTSMEATCELPLSPFHLAQMILCGEWANISGALGQFMRCTLMPRVVTSPKISSP